MTDEFFLDCNIWLILHCPIGNYRISDQRSYSRFINQLKISKRTIWVNSLVLSEFCNTWLRLDFNAYRALPGNTAVTSYKEHFVGTAKFLSTTQLIKNEVKKILSYTQRYSDNFNAIDLHNIFNEFGACDFNDSYYLELARMKNLKIITHDTDFFKGNHLGVKIITANIP